MTNESAHAILARMLDGVDPITGETLPPDHLCNHPQVIRALHAALISLTAADHSAPPVRRAMLSVNKNGRLNAGRAWTQEDIRQLKELFRSGASMAEMTDRLQRRRRGVEQQLKALRLISSDRPTIPGQERAGMPWTEEEDNYLIYLYMQKLPVMEMARELKRGEHAVFLRMKALQLYGDEAGYPLKNPPERDPDAAWTNRDTHTLRDLFKAGKSVEALSDYFHQSRENIVARLFYLGLIEDSSLEALRCHPDANPPSASTSPENSNERK